MSLALLLGPQLRAFRADGFEVVGASAPGPFVARLVRDGIRHVALRHATRRMTPLRDLQLLRELHQLCRRLRPDIVHTHNPKTGAVGRVAARAARVPVVVNTVHGLFAQPGDPLPRRALYLGIERIAGAFSDLELVQNPEDVETLRRLGVPRRKLRLLRNGVDLGHFDPATADPGRVAAVRAAMGATDGDVVCGMVGRLVHEKGYREFIDAALAVRGRREGAVFVAVGAPDPGRHGALSEAEIARGERAGVRFLGHRDDMVHVYAAMDVFVLASYREGWPRSAMEAAAMRRPVVATDVRGCREVVDDAVTGYLVPARSAEALAAAIERLVVDADLRRRLGEAGAAKARREFDHRQQIETTLAAYRSLLGSR